MKRRETVSPLRQKEAEVALELVKNSGLEKKLLHQAILHLDGKKLRKMGALGLCVAGAAAAVNAAGRYTFYRSALARELKKQLAPIHKQLDEIEEELETLKKSAKR